MEIGTIGACGHAVTGLCNLQSRLGPDLQRLYPGQLGVILSLGIGPLSPSAEAVSFFKPWSLHG